ncbi:MAG: nicotinate-nucleotide--dimethylbenzimidazole phosphoribosyltransferase, partial [Chloroflexi bacterium]|nr:nicotinate-nucleotide--dimethylbenzimidazole phosphoribosyltransferase [Chloroflexota bacterium]
MTTTLKVPLALIQDTVQATQPPDENARGAARARQDQLTKPQGSLGRLEALSVQLASITAQPRPRFHQPVII